MGHVGIVDISPVIGATVDGAKCFGGSDFGAPGIDGGSGGTSVGGPGGIDQFILVFNGAVVLYPGVGETSDRGG